MAEVLPIAARESPVAGVTALMLLAGLILPGLYVNLSLSAHDVGGAVMPPGMIMDFDTPGAAMRDSDTVEAASG